jgi:hypothetical protein
LRPDGPSGCPSWRRPSAARLRARLDTREFELGNLQLLVPPARPSVFPRYFPCAEGRLTNYQFFLPQCQFTLRAIPPRCHSGATPSRCPLAAPFNACGLVKIIDVGRNLSASCRWRSCALEVRPNSRLRGPWCPSTEECTGRHLSAVLRRASPLPWSGRSRTRSLPHLRAQLFGNCARNGGRA